VSKKQKQSDGGRRGGWGDGRVSMYRYGVQAHEWTAKERRMHTPLFVTINQPRRYGTDVRGGTYKQEDDEKEGLEVEERGLRSAARRCRAEHGGKLSVGSKHKRVRSLREERDRPWCCWIPRCATDYEQVDRATDADGTAWAEKWLGA
jgi:hypothetical protein